MYCYFCTDDTCHVGGSIVQQRKSVSKFDAMHSIVPCKTATGELMYCGADVACVCTYATYCVHVVSLLHLY